MTFLTLNYIFDKNFFNFWNFFFVLLSNFLGINCMLSFYVKNPIFSLIFLIINYLFAAVMMLFFGVQFLVFIFLLIYVGAISILMLFTLMLLNLKIIFYKNINFTHFILFFVLILILEVILFYHKDFFSLFYYTQNSSVDWFSIYFFKNEISIFGTQLFLNNKDLIFLSAIFLFLVLIASINIVLNLKYSKKQSLSLQLKNINKIIKR